MSLSKYNKAKRRLLQTMLETNSSVRITLHPGVNGVQVPAIYKSDPEMALNISNKYKFPVTLGVSGIYTTLTFQGESKEVKIPWEALYGMQGHTEEVMAWFPKPTEKYLNKTEEVDDLLNKHPFLRVVK